MTRLWCFRPAVRVIAVAVSVSLVWGVMFAAPGVAQESDTRADSPNVGSFGIGGAATAGISEQTGALSLQLPLATLPGVLGEGVALGVSYHQDATDRGDLHGLGAGWSWSEGSRVLVGGDVTVLPASGGMFVADTSTRSGLTGYLQNDVVFRQENGIVGLNVVGAPVPVPVADASVAYAFSLEHSSGTDFFDNDGLLVVRKDLFGHATRFEWDAADRLVAVTDNAGSKVSLTWTDAGVVIAGPQRCDGVVPVTQLSLGQHGIESVIDPVGREMTLSYDAAGMLGRVVAPSGATTHVLYGDLPARDGVKRVVREVTTRDQGTGADLSRRRWETRSENNYTGYPLYSDPGALAVSGNGEYRYVTRLTDGATSIDHEYNSTGLLMSKRVFVSSSRGERLVQEQAFTYPDSEGGRVPQPGAVPPNYAKPTSVAVTFHDGEASRTVTEQSVFDDHGRLVEHRNTDGAETVTDYERVPPTGRTIPAGLVRAHTTTGADGAVTKTINTLNDDRTAIVATAEFTGTVDELSAASLTEYTVDAHGFVSEQRVRAVRPAGEGPETVVTRFSRTINTSTAEMTLTQTRAAGDAAESATSTTVDIGSGLVMKERDPLGRITAAAYDAVGREISRTDAAGRVTTITYEEDVTRVTDPRGVTRSERVDVLGRVTEMSDNVVYEHGQFVVRAGQQRVIETRRYENNGARVTVTDQRGATSVTETDVFGRVVSVKAATGTSIVTEYDDVANEVRSGRLAADASTLAGAEQVTVTRNDDSDREILRTGKRRDGRAVPEKITTYDGLGRVATATEADVEERFAFNPDGTRRSAHKVPQSPTEFPGTMLSTDREFDVSGAATTKTLSGPAESAPGVTRVLDAAGRTISEADQFGRVTTFEYTPDDLVQSVRNGGSGAATRNSYDPVTRALVFSETTSSSGGVQVAYEYDPVTDELQSVFDPGDREATELCYTYDPLGNVTHVRYPDGRTIRHSFDEFGGKESTTDIAGNTTFYRHNDAGLLVEARQQNAAGEALGAIAYGHDTSGRVDRISRSNGVETRYSFTSADQIETETTRHGAKIIFDAEYEYDAHGNLARAVSTRPSGLDLADTTTQTVTHKYNAYNQLIGSATYDGNVSARSGELLHREGVTAAPEHEVAYLVGVTGNVLRETTTLGSTQTVREFEYNTLGQTTAITTDGQRAEQHYDPAGNLTRAADGTLYAYTAANQPLTETRRDGSVTSHSYWVTGQRRETIVGGDVQTTGDGASAMSMYWDGDTLLNEVHGTREQSQAVRRGADEALDPVVSYLVGASRHIRTVGVQAAQSEFSVADRHGSTVALVNSNGAVTTTYGYSDYGDVRVHTTRNTEGVDRNPFQYSGEFTTVHGDQNLGPRRYDPGSMAFTTKDSADEFNLYAYAHANPITWVDPTGRSPEFDAVTDGILPGIGLLISAVGLAGSLWPTPPSLGLVSIGIAITGITDLGLLVTLVTDAGLDKSGRGFLDDSSATFLGWGSFIVGLAAGLGGGVAAFKKYRAKYAPDQFDETSDLASEGRMLANDDAIEMQTLGAMRDVERGDIAQLYEETLTVGAEQLVLRVGKYERARSAYNTQRHLPAGDSGAVALAAQKMERRLHDAHDVKNMYNAAYRYYASDARRAGEPLAFSKVTDGYSLPERPCWLTFDFAFITVMAPANGMLIIFGAVGAAHGKYD